MAEIYRLPAVSPTMETGTIVKWRVAEGAAFASGTVLAEIGTDKATMEAEIFDEGTLLVRLVEEGDEVPVNAPLAILGAPGEDVAALVASARAELVALRSGTAPAATTTPAAPTATPAVEAPTPAQPPAATAPSPTPTWMGRTLPRTFLEPPGDVGLGRGRPAVGSPRAPLATDPALPASPAARKAAQELGVDLHRVSGSGPRGRIVRSDVEAAASSGPASTAPARRADETLKLTPMRKTIARRLTQSHQDVPTFFLTVAFDVAAWVTLRDALKVRSPDVKVSYNDLLMAAVARALREHPPANASWTDTGIVRHGRVDLGFAVALDEGLITPVVRDADRLSIAQLAAEVRRLSDKARAGKLTPEEYTGATFTVSNLGMFGIEHFTAILNPPEAGILAAGAVLEEPVVVAGRLTTGWRMRCTLTCDHRVMDGAVGARFLQILRSYVEAPGLLAI